MTLVCCNLVMRHWFCFAQSDLLTYCFGQFALSRLRCLLSLYENKSSGLYQKKIWVFLYLYISKCHMKRKKHYTSYFKNIFFFFCVAKNPTIMFGKGKQCEQPLARSELYERREVVR